MSSRSVGQWSAVRLGRLCLFLSHVMHDLFGVHAVSSSPSSGFRARRSYLRRVYHLPPGWRNGAPEFRRDWLSPRLTLGACIFPTVLGSGLARPPPRRVFPSVFSPPSLSCTAVSTASSCGTRLLGNPARSRILASIWTATSALSLRKALACSRPWPRRRSPKAIECAALFDDVELDTQVQQVSLGADSLTVHDVELRHLDGAATLFLRTAHTRAVADHLTPLFDRLNPPYVQPHTRNKTSAPSPQTSSPDCQISPRSSAATGW